MKTIIIEDEKHSAIFLHNILTENFSNLEVVTKLRSVEESILWLNQNPEPELIFIDIELSDGTCFEILESTKVKSKLIFTTAYDQHALKAFEYNSIAYILKPVTAKKINEALEKLNHNNYYQNNNLVINELSKILKKEYKKRFLVKRGDKFWHINTDNIAYFVSEDGLTVAYLFDNRKFFIDHSLDELEKLLDPQLFFRINRKIILQITSIETVKTYFTRRLILDVTPKYNAEIIVSKERASHFKNWLDA